MSQMKQNDSQDQPVIVFSNQSAYWPTIIIIDVTLSASPPHPCKKFENHYQMFKLKLHKNIQANLVVGMTATFSWTERTARLRNVYHFRVTRLRLLFAKNLLEPIKP